MLQCVTNVLARANTLYTSSRNDFGIIAIELVSWQIKLATCVLLFLAMSCLRMLTVYSIIFHIRYVCIPGGNGGILFNMYTLSDNIIFFKLQVIIYLFFNDY